MIKIILFISIIVSFLNANIKDNIKSLCSSEYTKYSNTIDDYLIRLEDSIKTNGCKAIPVFYAIIDNERFDILDEIDNNTELLKNLIKLFKNKKIGNLAIKNEMFKEIVLHNSFNKKFMHNFSSLLEHELTYNKIMQINKNSYYLDYFLISALYAKDNKEVEQIYKKLNHISIDLVPSFILLVSALEESGSLDNINELVEGFINIQKELSKTIIKKLLDYPQYFTFLLYPSSKDLNISIVSNYRLRKIKEDIQQKSLFIFENIYKKYNRYDYAFKTIEYLYPYLLENYKISIKDYKILMSELIKNGYLLSLFNKDVCQPSLEEKFQIFGQKNIINGAKLLKEDSEFAYKLLHDIQSSNGIYYYFFVANFYKNYNNSSWQIFKSIFNFLPLDNEQKIKILVKLEKINYFQIIENQKDYNVIVKTDNKKYPKYQFILSAHYPSQSDKTLIEQIITNNIDDKKFKQYILELMQKDIDELASQRYSLIDKASYWIDKSDTLDTILMGASIVAIPFTGGTSLAVTGSLLAKKASKIAVKKTILYIVKKRSKKLAIKAIKYSSKYAIKKVKNGTLLKNNSNIHKKIDNSIDNFSDTSGLLVGIRGLYFYLNDKDLNIKKVCEDKYIKGKL